jgi:hypothetical protein
MPDTLETQTHGSFYSGTIHQEEQRRTPININPNSIGSYDLDATENPFTSPHDSLSRNMISKVQSKYYKDQFTTPSAFMASYYPRMPLADSKAHSTLDSYELRTIETGDADLETGLGDTRMKEVTNQQYYEDGDRHRLVQTPKDDSHMRVRMMELAEAVETGSRTPRHPRPRRLHPYVCKISGNVNRN